MMSGRRPSLQLVAGRRHRAQPEARMTVAAQAVCAGPQDLRVSAMTPEATGRGYGHVCLRVGRMLVYLEDRDALDAWSCAIRQAQALADRAFGAELPPSRYEPRSVR